MFGLDVSETLPTLLEGVTFQIGLLADGRYDELAERYEEAKKPINAHYTEAHTKDGVFDHASTVHCARCRALEKEAMPVWRAIVREGVRGWDAPMPMTTEQMPFAGETYPVLDATTLDRLQVAKRGRLIWDLAYEVLRTNRLDTTQVLGFLSSSGA